MDKILLGVLFALSVVLAFGGLHQLQNLPLSEIQESSRVFWNLAALGYGSAAFAFISGIALVLLSR